MPDLSPHRVLDRRRCLIGESPRWDPDTGRVHWVDILGGEVRSCRLDGSDVAGWAPGGRLGGMVLRSGGRGWVLAQDRAIRCWDADGRLEATLVEEVPGDGQGLRINELAVDPAGRLVFGTMTTDRAPGVAALWRREHDGSLRVLRDGLTVSNGLGWTPDGSAVYHADSPMRQVARLGYGDGGLQPPEVVVTVDTDGVPDGLCVDGVGGFWLAVHGAGQVRHHRADGTEDVRLRLPAAAVTSCTLADGPDGPLLVVTSACEGMEEPDLLDQPDAGCCFAIAVDTPPGAPAPWPW